MTLLPALIALAAIVAFAAVFSGAEIGMYSLSRTRLESEAGLGHRSARMILVLVRNETWLLTTLLVANNLMHQLATLVGESLLAPFDIPPSLHEFAITLLVAPPILLFGELFPKDLFRRRPHSLVGWTAPLVLGVRFVLAPLVAPLYLVTSTLTRFAGLDRGALARVQGREAVIEVLRERESQLQPHVEKLARNVLELRSLRVDRVMVPWKRVEVLRAERPISEHLGQIGISPFSRLPLVDARGQVRGYVHQLEVLGAPPSDGLARHLRPLLAFEPDTPLDRALARLKAAGQRAALVGSPAKPLGLVTLKDLVEEISGELARW